MITVKQEKVNGIPLLEVVSTESENETLPTVVFYHGWTNFKESSLVHGYEIAKKGFRVLIPEAYLHGERSQGAPVTERSMEFWDVVQHSIVEFPTIIDHYVNAGLTDQNRIGVSGLSMGGVTTSALLTQYPWIKTAVVLMGSPAPIPFSKWLLTSKWQQGVEIDFESEQFAPAIESLKAISLDLQPEKIDGKFIHFWHDEDDELVPYQPTFDFYKKIKDQDYGQHVSFTTTEGYGHHVPYIISVETAEFFNKHL
ncbi:prolyl oligopeptidase family serine peptidase [Carnobacterium sp. 17-4]|uniref:prolyl oligopeptidase family serine peptidase n=1 Tax=Carnobacterium sp. (strain 17-4) TaxID=208596 RepID=UPI0002E62CC5|nr:prolyl oligopeptidase family serine peptidase [Carnobacterium sp. 17-4]